MRPTLRARLWFLLSPGCGDRSLCKPPAAVADCNEKAGEHTPSHCALVLRAPEQPSLREEPGRERTGDGKAQRTPVCGSSL